MVCKISKKAVMTTYPEVKRKAKVLPKLDGQNKANQGDTVQAGQTRGVGLYGIPAKVSSQDANHK